jgi:PAS domain S-box-containing protein
VEQAAKSPAWGGSPGARGRLTGLVVAFYAGYVACYVALDHLSFVDALYGLNITAWTPSAGITLFLLIVRGPRCFPVVVLAEVLSQIVVSRGSIPPAPLFVAALMPAAIYSGAAVFLRKIGFERSLLRTSDLVKLLLTAIVASGLRTGGAVGSYAAANLLPWVGFVDAAFRDWIGDAIGIMVFTPALLILNEPATGYVPPHTGRGRLAVLESAVQAAAVVAVLAAMFLRLRGGHPFELFYLLFVPIVWIATRHGLRVTSWVLVAIQAGLIVGFELQDPPAPEALHAYQLLMMALAVTGLLLGAVISERYRLSYALAESENHRATILNTARDGILTMDARGSIQSINAGVEQLFAQPGHLLVGRNVCDFVGVSPDELAQLIRTAGIPGAARTWEFLAQRGDETFPIEMSAARFDLNPAEQYVLVLRDITRRRQAEIEVRQHQAELAHFSRVSLAGEMAAGLAHELSQPLTAIAAYARGCLLVLDASNPDPALLHEGVAQVVEQAERAGSVLSQLREFVRPRTSPRELVEVKALVDAAVALARVETVQRRVAIATRLEPNLPPVFADPIQIEQVLLNLLRNATDAIVGAEAKQRSILIEGRCNSSAAIEISVADSGPGVAGGVVDTIFDPFVTTKPLGMGMGLAISRSILRSHGGSLRLVRNTASGATFAFDLPTETDRVDGRAC